MNTKELLQLRLQHQQITQHTVATPEELVAWMGAVQAQDYAMAQWALGLRLPGTTEQQVEDALSKGTIIRTHILRPTWHYVAPADIRWMLKLTAPRIHSYAGHYYRKLELDQKVLGKSNKVLEKILGGNRQLTRPEIASALEQAKIDTSDLRLNHLLIYAELEGLICNGARQGKHITYALLEERVPPATELNREESLATLCLRYFQSHGPATVKDFAWWSGLSLTEARQATDLLSDRLEWVTHGDEQMAFIEQGAAAPLKKEEIELFPNFDEYLVAYTDRELAMSSTKATLSREGNPIFNNTIIIKGKVEGCWKRSVTARSVSVTPEPFAPFSPTQEKQWQQAVKRYRSFLEK